MFVVFEGCNGCGKTTTIDAFIKNPPPLFNKIIRVTIKDTLKKYPKLLEAFKTRHTFGLTLDQTHSLAYAHIDFINECVELADQQDAIVIADRSIASFYVYQQMGTGKYVSMEIYKEQLQKLEAHIHYIYLAPGIDVLLNRLVNRHDSIHLLPYVKDLSGLYDRYFQHELTGGEALTVRDTDLTTIVAKVSNHLKLYHDQF